MPCTITEAAELAAALPLAFRKEDEVWHLDAILRLTTGGPSAIVGPDGSWRAVQVPRMLRFYPFAMGSHPAEQQVLLIDADAMQGTDETGLRFFEEDGALAPEVSRVVEEMQRWHAKLPMTHAAIAGLEAAGVLTELTLGERVVPNQFMVDAARFQALPGAEMTRLHSIHAAGLAFVQIVSMHHMSWLRKATQHAARAAATTTTASGDTSDFLSALSAARIEDLHDPAALVLGRLSISDDDKSDHDKSDHDKEEPAAC